MGLAPQKIDGDMAEYCKGLGSLLFTDPTGILLKRDIEDPMQRVLDTPVLPYGLSESHGLGWQRRQKIPGGDLDRFAYFTTCFNHPHAAKVRTRGFCTKPFNLRRDPIPTRFNAAVIPIDGFVVRVLDIRKRGVPGIVEKQCHRLRERR